MKSFNAWLDEFAGDDVQILRLASFWKRSRGRLTRDTVERRALECGCYQGTGYAAWDAYISDITLNPFKNTSPQFEKPEHPLD